jgi:glyoxylase-like metal-dependent hydrolase (beta-lactamase superfamily II)
VLDVLGIPGHEDSHIALYDRDNALLLTGDTLYPGFLVIDDAASQGNFVEYQASIQRLVDFTAGRPVNWVLGAHVEMTSTPGVAYRYGTNNQPSERMLHLDRDHLLELNDAVIAMGADPAEEIHDDFIIRPTN